MQGGFTRSFGTSAASVAFTEAGSTARSIPRNFGPAMITNRSNRPASRAFSSSWASCRAKVSIACLCGSCSPAVAWWGLAHVGRTGEVHGQDSDQGDPTRGLDRATAHADQRLPGEL